MQPPAMDPLEVAKRPAATVRVYCPRQRTCLYAAERYPAGPDGEALDDPAEQVIAAAGCRTDPPDCPCAAGQSQQQATVAAVATTARTVTPLGSARTRATAAPGATPQPATLADATALDARPVPDTPLVSARAVVSLSGGALDLATVDFAEAQPAGDDSDDEG